MSAGSEVDERTMSEIIKIAAELASGVPLKACADLLGMERITRQRLARATSADDEICRLLAIRLRKAWDALSASRADRVSAAPTEPIVGDDDLTAVYLLGKHDGRKAAERAASAAPTEGVEPVGWQVPVEIDRYIALSIRALRIHAQCGDCFPENGWPEVNEAIAAYKALQAAPTRPAAPDAVEALSDDAMRAAYAEQFGRPWTRDEDGTRFKNGWNAARSVLQQIDGKKG